MKEIIHMTCPWMVRSLIWCERSSNSYMYLNVGAREGDVWVALLKKEAQLAKDGMPPLHSVPPSGFVILGLELEDQQ